MTSDGALFKNLFSTTFTRFHQNCRWFLEPLPTAPVTIKRFGSASATWQHRNKIPRIDRGGGVEDGRLPPSAPPCRSSDLAFFLKFCCALGLKVAPNSPDPCIEAVFEPAEVVRIGIRSLCARTVVFEMKNIFFFIFEVRHPPVDPRDARFDTPPCRSSESRFFVVKVFPVQVLMKVMYLFEVIMLF